MDSFIDITFTIALLQATIRTTAPLLLAALGGVFSENSGVLCIGMEGIMIVGAFTGFLGALYSGNLWIGVFTAGLAGMLIALIYGYLTIEIGGSQAVVGTATVLFAYGLTGFFNRVLFGVDASFTRIETFKSLPIAGLSRIPILGEIFFNQNILVYLAFILVPISWLILYRTSWGLIIRSVGEHPKAADTVGLGVKLTRYISVAISGILGGIGGAYLSLAHANTFSEIMTAEKGYIAFVIVIFGKYNPVGAMAAALLFGLAEALQIRLQTVGVNIAYQFLLMLPYLVTLVVMVAAGRTIAPSALGKAYKKN